jgi:putative nucleotidyltransferase with HDIG domain
MKESQVLARIDKEYKLFSLPEILAQVIQAVEDKNSSIGLIADVVSKDVALTSKILRISNSSFYGRMNKVSSVTDAVGVLGTRTIKSIALSVSVYDLCRRLDNRLDIKDFWRHSLEVAILSELVARKTDARLAEEAFVCGLLHDIGILILDSTFSKDYEKVWHLTCKGNDLIKTEESIIGTNHVKVGTFLAEKWNLPERLANAIMDHHRTFDLREPKSEEVLSQIVCLASRISNYQMDGLSYIGRKDFDNKKALLHNLGLVNDDIAEIRSEAVTRLIETAQFLEMDVGSPLDLVQKANDLLFQLMSQIEALYSSAEEGGTRIPKGRLDAIATDVMHTVVATFSHYFNNACATILGRSQLLEMSIDKGDLKDTDNRVLKRSIEVIQRGVESITNVLNVMKSVESFDTVQYHESAKIIDLKEQLDELTADKLEPMQQM